MHLVWATHGRLPLILPHGEADLYECVRLEATKLRLEVLAIGGIEDHVHLAIRLPATRTIAEIMKQIKGASSHHMSQVSPDGFFKWQEGYGAFAFHTSLTPRIIAYIENQKTHHANGELLAALEESDEEAPLSNNFVREDAGEAWLEARYFNASP
ncbi:transposase [Armatimonas sp.]|uniref:transposase n=1 Tax=Armatimonas sp. TaxID=1872638 RepID=UPI00286BECFB|nr:transposase [Armatimonas sp.]